MGFAAGLIVGFVIGVIVTVEWALCAANKRREDNGRKDKEGRNNYT